MTPNQYAAAVVDLLLKGVSPERVFDGLEKTLLRRGHMKLRKAILKRAHTLYGQKTKSERATVRVARESDADIYADAIKKDCAQLNMSTQPQITLDGSLIGGYLLETQDQLVDKSYKRALVALYRNIITN